MITGPDAVYIVKNLVLQLEKKKGKLNNLHSQQLINSAVKLSHNTSLYVVVQPQYMQHICLTSRWHYVLLE